MKVCFLKPAQLELDDAFLWYEAQSHGLGTQFLDEFKAGSGLQPEPNGLCMRESEKKFVIPR